MILLGDRRLSQHCTKVVTSSSNTTLWIPSTKQRRVLLLCRSDRVCDGNNLPMLTATISHIIMNSNLSQTVSGISSSLVAARRREDWGDRAESTAPLFVIS